MTFLCHHLTIYRLKAFKNKKVITFCISVLLTLESRLRVTLDNLRNLPAPEVPLFLLLLEEV